MFIPDDPNLQVTKDPGDTEPLLLAKRGYTDPDDPCPL